MTIGVNIVINMFAMTLGLAGLDSLRQWRRERQKTKIKLAKIRAKEFKDKK